VSNGHAAPSSPADDPVATAEAFVDAVAWGEHHRVWELLADDGRETVLRVAATRGMDQDLATRLRDGTATASERDEFLIDLVNGLRADLAGADLDNVEYAVDPEPLEAGRARVVIIATLPEPLAVGGGIPAGSVDLVHDGARWRVERIVPRLAK
jgi:hypothetical protein